MTLLILGSLLGSVVMASAILCALGIGVRMTENPFHPSAQRNGRGSEFTPSRPFYVPKERIASRALLRENLRRVK
jgi:hypothetical protein